MSRQFWLGVAAVVIATTTFVLMNYLRLSDEIEKAPEEVVEELRERREDAVASATKLKHALEQIKGVG